MFSSFTLFRVFGTEVRINSTLFYMALFHFTTVVSGSGTFESLNTAVPLYVAAFASILVHEFGHVAVAHLRGIGCDRITLHALGGLAELDKAPYKPIDEFLIAIAGPITSVMLAAGLYLLLQVGVPSGDLVVDLMLINVIIAVFNMVPAYPMDGGQVLHAFMRSVMHRKWADRLCVVTGQVLAVALVALGIFLREPVMVVIACLLFVFAAVGLGHPVFWFLHGRGRTAPDGAAPEDQRD